MQRTRSEGGFNDPPPNQHTLSYFGSRPDDVSPWPASGLLSTGRTKTMIDTVTPNFKKASASGDVIVNPMWSQETTQSGSVTPTTHEWVGAPIDGNVRLVKYDYLAPSILPNVSFSSADTESMKIEAYTRAMASVNAPDVLGLVDIAEARRTISSLAGIVNQFRSIVSGIRNSAAYRQWLRRRSLRDSWDALVDHISSEWLRYRYFFIPLALSAQGIVKALDSKTPRPERQTARSRMSVTASGMASSTTYGAPLWDITTSVTGTVEVVCRAGILTQTKRGKCLTSRLGLEAQFVPQAAWELVPFSFVVDWFLNVGDLVAAVTPDAGTDVLGSWTIVEKTETYTWNVRSIWTAGDGYPIVRNPGSGSGVVKVITRERVPGGRVGLVGRSFQGRLVDLIHLADAIALLRQLAR